MPKGIKRKTMSTTQAGHEAKQRRAQRAASKAEPGRYLRSHFFSKGDARLQVIEYDNAIELRQYNDAEFSRQTDWNEQSLDGVPAEGLDCPTSILEVFARVIAFGWTHYKSTNT